MNKMSITTLIAYIIFISCLIFIFISWIHIECRFHKIEKEYKEILKRRKEIIKKYLGED